MVLQPVFVRREVKCNTTLISSLNKIFNGFASSSVLSFKAPTVLPSFAANLETGTPYGLLLQNVGKQPEPLGLKVGEQLFRDVAGCLV
jgi:hypothetical protein